jgi:hypothetical protein
VNERRAIGRPPSDLWTPETWTMRRRELLQAGAGLALGAGVRPTINAIGTLMLVISFLIVALAVALPRLLGRHEEENVLIGREAA